MKKLLILAALLPTATSAQDRNLAYEITAGLTTEVGQRLAGTEQEAMARTWATLKLKALGFQNVRIEPFEMKGWVRGEGKAEITAPYPHKLAITALGHSGTTPDNGLTGTVVVYSTYADFLAAPDAAIKGKIVYVGHAMGRTQDGSSYGVFGRVRRE